MTGVECHTAEAAGAIRDILDPPLAATLHTRLPEFASLECDQYVWLPSVSGSTSSGQ